MRPIIDDYRSGTYFFEAYVKGPNGEAGWDIVVGVVLACHDRKSAVEILKEYLGDSFDEVIQAHAFAGRLVDHHLVLAKTSEGVKGYEAYDQRVVDQALTNAAQNGYRGVLTEEPAAVATDLATCDAELEGAAPEDLASYVASFQRRADATDGKFEVAKVESGEYRVGVEFRGWTAQDARRFDVRDDACRHADALAALFADAVFTVTDR